MRIKEKISLLNKLWEQWNKPVDLLFCPVRERFIDRCILCSHFVADNGSRDCKLCLEEILSLFSYEHFGYEKIGVFLKNAFV